MKSGTHAVISDALLAATQFAPYPRLPCSFRDPVRYELGSRGLVVVTGQVHDTAEAGKLQHRAGLGGAAGWMRGLVAVTWLDWPGAR